MLFLDEGFRWGFPENASLEGGRIDELFWIMTVATVPILLVVVGFVAYSLIRFRERPGHHAEPIRGFRTRWGTGIMVAVLLLVELPLDYYQEDVWADMTARSPKLEDAWVVQILAQQFVWNIRYAGKDGKFGTVDDLYTINDLRAPLDKPVVCIMRSRDVIHSFWLPNFRVKMDVVPGFSHRVWFQATRTGTFEIACAELCGMGHYQMRGLLRVQTPEALNQWLKEMSQELEEYGPPDEAKRWKVWSE